MEIIKSNLKRKTRFIYMLPIRNTFEYKRKEWEDIHHGNAAQKKAGLGYFFRQVDFRANHITRDKEDLFTIIKG